MAGPANPLPETRRVESYDVYRALPDDGNRYEVFEGELVVTPSPKWRHQVVADAFCDAINAHVVPAGLGLASSAPLDVILAEGTYVQPDVVFVERERVSPDVDHVSGAPALCIEVFSGSTMERDRSEKKGLYERHGVRHYWIVDPYAETVDELVLHLDKYLQAQHLHGDVPFESALLSSLRIDLGAIWSLARQVG